MDARKKKILKKLLENKKPITKKLFSIDLSFSSSFNSFISFRIVLEDTPSNFDRYLRGTCERSLCK
jgi:predicted component of viral defense system (DUF524 family)